MARVHCASVERADEGCESRGIAAVLDEVGEVGESLRVRVVEDGAKKAVLAVDGRDEGAGLRVVMTGCSGRRRLRARASGGVVGRRVVEGRRVVILVLSLLLFVKIKSIGIVVGIKLGLGRLNAQCVADAPALAFPGRCTAVLGSSAEPLACV
ncbi:MAG: hypothetical protein KC766_42280, partial [Myxococcales bacterium]|nr:hypothetical protein [Myxococcales bacterium]